MIWVLVFFLLISHFHGSTSSKKGSLLSEVSLRPIFCDSGPSPSLRAESREKPGPRKRDPVLPQIIKFHFLDILINYDGYYSTKFRHGLLLPLHGCFDATIDPRPTEFSDFDLIRLESNNYLNFTEAISNIKEIIKITEDKLHFRTLNGAFKKESIRPEKTSKHFLDIPQIADLLRADRLWMKGFAGEGIDVAVFDTGITRRRTFFRNIKSLHDFTNENNSADCKFNFRFRFGLHSCPSEISTVSDRFSPISLPQQGSLVMTNPGQKSGTGIPGYQGIREIKVS